MENKVAAYLFAHFTGETALGEQVYFSLSRDGLHWTDLNGGKPMLQSAIGEKGVRDPFIVRHPETGMFYLMATDLNIYHRHGDWHGAKYAGSRDIILWESRDLISWSEPRVVTIAPENAGCAWAPEAVWDQQAGAFLVFFASYTEKAGEDGGRGRIRIYACHTKDFRSFSPAFEYMERPKSVIDTTIVQAFGMYYRFSKDATTGCIRVERGKELLGDFSAVDCAVLDAMPGLEGPECYQLPDGRWCLICDQYQARKGYLPMVIDDLESMMPVVAAAYDFGQTVKRHGGVLRIDDAMYERLIHYDTAS